MHINVVITVSINFRMMDMFRITKRKQNKYSLIILSLGKLAICDSWKCNISHAGFKDTMKTVDKSLLFTHPSINHARDDNS